MTCLMDRVLGGAGKKLHTSMLGTFFVCSLAICMQIVKKNLRGDFWENVCSNITTMKSLEPFHIKIQFLGNTPNVQVRP